jgi:hypothetical protein
MANTTCQKALANCVLVESTRRTGDLARELYVLLVLSKDTPAGSDLIVIYPLPDGVACRCGARGCVGAVEAAEWISGELAKIIDAADLREMARDRVKYRDLRAGLFPFKERFRKLGINDPRPFDGILKCDLLTRMFDVGLEEVAGTLELSELLLRSSRKLHRTMGWPDWAPPPTVAGILSKQSDNGGVVLAVQQMFDEINLALGDAVARDLDKWNFLSASVGAFLAGYVGALRSVGSSIGRRMSRRNRGLSVVVAADCRRALGRDPGPVQAEDLGLWAYALRWGGRGTFLPPGRMDATESDIEAISGLGNAGIACAVRLRLWADGSRYAGGSGGVLGRRTTPLFIGDV